jgi:Flp pilus assembly pilin Flp
MEVFMKGFRDFLWEEDGVAVIEIVLILVVLIGLVVIFNTKIKDLNTKIFNKITTESNKLL